MNVTIEHPFCPYCSEVTNLYFRIINTLLFFKRRKRTSHKHGESKEKRPGLTSISRSAMGHTIFGYANENRATKTKSFHTAS